MLGNLCENRCLVKLFLVILNLIFDVATIQGSNKKNCFFCSSTNAFQVKQFLLSDPSQLLYSK